MNQQPIFITSPARLLAGRHATVSIYNDLTNVLWQSFMAVRGQIPHIVGSDHYSVSVYPDDYFASFNPALEFEKWAGDEVSSAADLPDSFDLMQLPAGLYAVFLYEGLSSESAPFFQYIFNEWLPKSGFKLAHPLHFEIMGENYSNDDPDSEESVWIPIVSK